MGLQAQGFMGVGKFGGSRALNASRARADASRATVAVAVPASTPEPYGAKRVPGLAWLEG